MLNYAKFLIIISPLTLSGCSNITPQEKEEIEQVAEDLLVKIVQDAIDK